MCSQDHQIWAWFGDLDSRRSVRGARAPRGMWCATRSHMIHYIRGWGMRCEATMTTVVMLCAREDQPRYPYPPWVRARPIPLPPTGIGGRAPHVAHYMGIGRSRTCPTCRMSDLSGNIRTCRDIGGICGNTRTYARMTRAFYARACDAMTPITHLALIGASAGPTP